jgi:citrate synthase
MQDAEQKIARPRQIYTGYDEREFAPMEQRKAITSVTVKI